MQQVAGPIALHDRLDYLFAALAATIVNVNLPKGRAPVTVSDTRVSPWATVTSPVMVVVGADV